MDATKLFDHFLMKLRLGKGSFPTKYPFKYCPIWSLEESFIFLVQRLWDSMAGGPCSSALQRLPIFLRHLKLKIAPWIRGKKHLLQADLQDVEISIAAIRSRPFEETMYEPTWSQLGILEDKKTSLMRKEEELWRIKSRALWLACGDKNTRLFQAFADNRRKKKAIWEIEDEGGHLFNDHASIAGEAVSYFSGIYNCHSPSNLETQLQVLKVMPHFFYEHDCISIYAPVTLTGIEGILKSMDKEKSPGPNSWSAEFFIQF